MAPPTPLHDKRFMIYRGTSCFAKGTSCLAKEAPIKVRILNKVIWHLPRVCMTNGSWDLEALPVWPRELPFWRRKPLGGQATPIGEHTNRGKKIIIKAASSNERALAAKPTSQGSLHLLHYYTINLIALLHYYTITIITLICVVYSRLTFSFYGKNPWKNTGWRHHFRYSSPIEFNGWVVLAWGLIEIHMTLWLSRQ